MKQSLRVRTTLETQITDLETKRIREKNNKWRLITALCVLLALLVLREGQVVAAVAAVAHGVNVVGAGAGGKTAAAPATGRVALAVGVAELGLILRRLLGHRWDVGLYVGLYVGLHELLVRAAATIVVGASRLEGLLLLLLLLAAAGTLGQNGHAEDFRRHEDNTQQAKPEHFRTNFDVKNRRSYVLFIEELRGFVGYQKF